MSKVKNYIALILIFALIICAGVWLYHNEENLRFNDNLKLLHDKANLLYSHIASGDMAEMNAVFISLSDGKSRARVYSCNADNLNAAWRSAVSAAEQDLKAFSNNIKYVKADIAFNARDISSKSLKREIKASRHEFYRNSLAFDNKFNLALLEAELNGAKIYDYKSGGIDLNYLNNYLLKSGRKNSKLKSLPESYIAFNTRGWLCDENNNIFSLIYDDKLAYGRRDVKIDDKLARELITKSASFLLRQLTPDGSFIYGMYPRFDNKINSYNILRHAGTVWSLCLNYRLNPSAELKSAIESALNYLASQVIYKDNSTAYVNEAKAGELKLGGMGIAVLAFTEYMDLFSKNYLDLCEKLGAGILSMMDLNTGKFVHVLNTKDFKLKDAYRTVFYDGEATFALVRLYSLTHDKKYLDAALKSVDNFIANNYIQHKDHWIAYSLNELLKYVNDDKYYDFALQNAFKNLQFIESRETTNHINLELLMAAFEVYDRFYNKLSAEQVKKFNIKALVKAIDTRVHRQLNGYFFPEYAMYMAKPDKILDTFMVRHDGYRVRIDDVQHNIGGYYLYYKNYDKLVKLSKGE